jgi:hypothetical protein
MKLKISMQWFIKSFICPPADSPDSKTKPVLPPVLCPQCMFGVCTVLYSPIQTESHRPKLDKFDRMDSTFNQLWKCHKEKNIMEQVNFLMNYESHNKSSRPRDPERLKRCLKCKGITLDEHQNSSKCNFPPLNPPTYSR